MYISSAPRIYVFLVMVCLWTPSFAQSRQPSFVKTITLKVEGDEECIRTSDYVKPPEGPCKDYGQCYQYRCGAVARHCSECGEYKGPCIDYEQEADRGGVNSRKRRSVRAGIATEVEEEESEPAPSPITNFMDSISSRMRRLVEKVRAAVQIVPSPQTVPIENIGSLIVHLRAGLQNCTGFITAVEQPEGKQYFILTAAKCLVRFETECYSGSPTFGEMFEANQTEREVIDGYTMYPYNHSWPCFGDYDSDVRRIKKGFLSYTVVVTSYVGRRYTIPLDSHHVIIPRDYMECHDCRYDYAAIKLNRDMAKRIIRRNEPFSLAPEKDPMEWTGEEVPQFVAVKNPSSPKLLRKSADTKFCTINYSTKEKMCFHLPVGPNQEHPILLPGSPLFVATPTQDRRMKYDCIGIFTGMYSVSNAVMSTEKLMEDGLHPAPEGNHITVDMKYSKNGAVRITPDFVSLLEMIGGAPMMNGTATGQNETGLVPQVFPPRRDCFPNLGQPFNGTEHLFLCSLGWKDEKAGCTEADVQITLGCSSTGISFKCDPRVKRDGQSAGDPQESIFQRITVPGTVEHLSLRGQGISDTVELSTVISRLPHLLDLILDYNDIEVLESGLFARNRELRMISLKYNNIRKLDHDIFRRNKKLRHVNLAHNQISVIPSDLLAKAAILQYINFENNQIRAVSVKLFLRTHRLEQIHFGSNNMSYFSPKLLSNLNALREFRFNNNKLRRITRFTFMSNPQLSLIDLSHNKLSVVPRNAFDLNLKLKYVNLNYNNITVLPRRLFIHQRSLASVSASQNPLTNPNRTRVYFESVGIPYS